MTKEIYLILHNIRSLHNVGSIFRTADCVGVKKIYLTGYTPAPSQKTALGAEKTVEWKRYKNISHLISNLQTSDVNNYGYRISIVGVEQYKNSIDYKKFKPKYPLALILGNEVRGISKQTLKKCNSIIEIPIHGQKESLNVAVATGVVLFQLID